ncbi:acid phosphatase PHOa [Aspergillus aculeatinus CBS 121060]|uniref:Phosphoesterase-domain-containing protein n=1 Tax=Aspergillus aculeatinus CBS 121060 TaxID=1448322 RepID=A0ACD1HIS8_9EURO|nr:phosphoesterase-domain-containing protein [Aspergillus aculeatinus CBS 121060]RAH73470.1 phosphoesterase-domain-containing protein [Aspergillus aculeatinus CBS 121060]
MKSSAATLLAAASVAYAQLANVSEPSLTEIEKAAATIEPYSPVSNVEGLVFNRFYQIWLENIDYEDAAADENVQWLASQGITLTNFYAVTHPSEPNYCASASGDTFGMDNDDFQQIPANVSTVADLLDTKNIAWGEYQEHLPYPGFQGYNYSNQVTYANDYVRKHNPLILFDSIAQNSTRLRQIKNFTSFEDDLANKKLPQWAFITPNMTDDAHDTNITFAAQWERSWVPPLLNNSYFMNDTLLLLTFDEDKTYPKGNKIFSILLGGVIPDNLKGTKDDTFYTHYSVIASVSANWGLPSLGRWDCGANILEIVANKTGYVNYDVDTTNLHLNETYPGPLSDSDYSEYSSAWPVPLTNGTCSAGHGILDIVKKNFANTEPTYNYTSPFPYDTKSKYNVDVTATRKQNSSNSSTSSSASSSAVANTGNPMMLPGVATLSGAVVALLMSIL